MKKARSLNGRIVPCASGVNMERQKSLQLCTCVVSHKPGEVILAEPALQPMPVESQEEERRDGPGGSPPGLLHFASSPTDVTMIPSSRCSTIPAGRNFSRVNSTLTASPGNSLPSTSRE